MKRGMMGKEEAKMMLAISMMLGGEGLAGCGRGERALGASNLRPDHVVDEDVGSVDAVLVVHEEYGAHNGGDEGTVARDVSASQSSTHTAIAQV